MRFVPLYLAAPPYTRYQMHNVALFVLVQCALHIQNAASISHRLNDHTRNANGECVVAVCLCVCLVMREKHSPA